MAKHKKKRAKKVSKGLHSSVSKTTIRLVRSSMTEADKMMNKLEAWRRGKKGYVTVATGDATRPFTKVSFDSYFGRGYDYKTVKFGNVKPADDQNRIEL